MNAAKDRSLLLLLTAGLLLMTPRLFEGGIGLDSALYASLARTLSSDWTFWGLKVNSDYFPQFWDHPPLMIWLNALLFKLVTPTDLTARLGNILLSLGSVFFVFRIGDQIWNRTYAILAAVCLLATQHFLSLAASLFLDIGCTFFGLLAVCNLLAFQRRSKWWNWLFAAVGLALAFLAKGVFALLPAGVMTFLALSDAQPIHRRAMSLTIPFVGTSLMLGYFALQAKYGDYVYFTHYFHAHFFESTHTVKDGHLQFGMVGEYLKLAMPFSLFAVLALPTVWLKRGNLPLKTLVTSSSLLSLVLFGLSTRNLSFYLSSWYPYHALCAGAFLSILVFARGRLEPPPFISRLPRWILTLAIISTVVLQWLPTRVRNIGDPDIYVCKPVMEALKKQGVTRVFTSGPEEDRFDWLNVGTWYWNLPVRFAPQSEEAQLDQALASTENVALVLSTKAAEHLANLAAAKDFTKVIDVHGYGVYAKATLVNDDVRSAFINQKYLR